MVFNRPILVISIDCECDKSLDWTTTNPITFHSIREGIPKLLQSLFNEFGAVPTYLLSNEVLEDDVSVKELKLLKGQFELGAHLHADYIEPKQIFKKYDGTLTSMYQCDCSEEVERAKLKNITNMFKQKFEYFPTSFRAGRFGIGSKTIKILKDLGYKVDTSVHPGLRNLTRTGEVNFLRVPIFPYFVASDNIVQRGESEMLEVPVTVYRHPVMKRLFPHLRVAEQKTFQEKLLKRIFPSVTLRPTFFSAQDMIEASKKIIKRSNSSPTVLNMMFHSMEITPGASPYAKDRCEVDKFLNRIRSYLKWWNDKKFRYSSLTGLYDMFEEN